MSDYSKTEQDIMTAVSKWYSDNIEYFRTDKFYGLDMQIELYAFVRDLHLKLNNDKS